MELNNTCRNVTDVESLKILWKDETHFQCNAKEWNDIQWDEVFDKVQKLRYRIYIQTQRTKANPNKENILRLKELQNKMLFSYDNLLVSVRRVTQINKGRNTPGLDTFLITGKEQRIRLVKIVRYRINILQWNPIAVRRTYIPKKNGKLRPLGIPTITDRVIQAIVKNSLEPEWEAKADIGSYGFRPGRCCADALEKIFITLDKTSNTSPRKTWVLDADIKGCFDNISHSFLINKLKEFPAIYLIERWLKAGYIHKNTFHDTDTGTPQGGIISPLLANIALDGIEKELGIDYRKRKTQNKSGSRLVLDDYIPKGNKISRRSYIRYADDFVVLCESEEDSIECRNKLGDILKVRGLELSEEKTNIRHIEEGFDFLGCNIKCYHCNMNIPAKRGEKIMGYKVLITPSKSNLKKYKEKLKIIFNEYRSHKTDILIDKLNPIIRGWANYFRPFSSRKAFEYMDAYLYWKQFRFGLRTHPNKGKEWIVEKYFYNHNKFKPKDRWVFGSSNKSFMLKHRWIKISRHNLVPNGYSPDDPSVKDFWWKKQTTGYFNFVEGATGNILGSGENKIASRQKHTCPVCLQTLYNSEAFEKHHLIEKKKGGSDTYSNLIWLHKVCHQLVTSKSFTKETLESNLVKIKTRYKDLGKTNLVVEKSQNET